MKFFVFIFVLFFGYSSQQPAPGATGTVFTVWAPHATAASVTPMTNVNGRWTTTKMSFDSTNETFTVNVDGAMPGDGYVFKFTTPSGDITRLDPRAQSIANGTENWKYSIIHSPDFNWGSNNFNFVPINKVVVYELHIPTFYVPNGAVQGTFFTAIEKLSYLQKIGITAIELMPIATFGGNAKGWGYNPCAPFAPMEEFGGYLGLKSFVKAANDLGMGVILDIVWNHAGGNNILQDYDGYKGPSGNGIYYFESKDNAETLWGPRFDYSSKEVRSYMLDSVATFIEEYHISGFRWDSTVCIRLGEKICWTSGDNIPSGYSIMQQANLFTAKYPSWTVAEDDQGYDKITQSVSSGGLGFNSQWGYPFYYGFEAQLVEPSNKNVDANTVAQILALKDKQGGDPHRCVFTENHDMASNQNKGRIPNIVDPGGNPYKPTYWAQKKATLGMGVVLTSQLYPMIFYGQEMLTYATFNYPVPPNLDWGLAEANAGIVQEITDLTSLRLNSNGYTEGLLGNESNVLLVSNDAVNKVVVLERTGYNLASTVVVINMYENVYANYELKNMPKDGTWYVRFNGDNKKYSSQYENYGVSQTQISVSNKQASLMVPKYSIIILSQ